MKRLNNEIVKTINLPQRRRDAEGNMLKLKSFSLRLRASAVKNRLFTRLSNNEKGAVLVTVLILLMIITLIGVIAVNISTVDIQIAGNQKRVSTVFEGAEAGIDTSIGVIENTLDPLFGGSLVPAGPVGVITGLDTVDLESEITPGDDIPDTASGSPDLTIALNGVTVNVDIDYMYSYIMPGWSAEMAVGHEGVGVTGGKAALYRLDSEGTM